MQTMASDTDLVVQRIRELSSRDEDYDELLCEVRKLAALSPKAIGSIFSPGTILYRGTNHHVTVPSRIEEIWFPPANCVRFGSASSCCPAAGSSMVRSSTYVPPCVRCFPMSRSTIERWISGSSTGRSASMTSVSVGMNGSGGFPLRR